MTIIGDVSENSGNTQSYTHSLDFQKEREAYLSHIETLKQENLQKQQTIEAHQRTIEKLVGK